MTKKIKSVLIANRGEPVRRAIRTFRKMGLSITTITTQEDMLSDWVAEGDYCLNVSSYLNAKEIVEKAKFANVDAVWPGWGFLSENEEFAKLVEDAGIIWVGPPPPVIEAMASKEKATQLAKKAGVTTIPEIILNVTEDEQDIIEQMKHASKDLGYPLLLKPALGGGGQGQYVIYEESDLKSALKKTMEINKKQFNSGPILVQKYFVSAKHIETQILADQHGSVVVLGERECSVQRRNQKVIEESPSPILTDDEREKLYNMSAQLAKEIKYENVGTVEFLYLDGEFYFLEMNTRLQVEHTVTEETTTIKGERLDLINEMIRSANGERLGFSQKDVQRSGHAIEARIYAEDPIQDYRPAPGTIRKYHFPINENIRIESAFSHYPVTLSAFYDPMIAKIIAKGKNRSEAIIHLNSYLKETVILGVPTNVTLCTKILENHLFNSGKYSTKLLQDFSAHLSQYKANVGMALSLAAIIEYIFDLNNVCDTLKSVYSTSFLEKMRSIPKNGQTYQIEMNGKCAIIKVFEESLHRFKVVVNNQETLLQVFQRNEHQFTCLQPDGKTFSVWAHKVNGDMTLFYEGDAYRLTISNNSFEQKVTDPNAAPLSGLVVAINAKKGESIKSGQELYQIEAMKMITTITSAFDGTIEDIKYKVGDIIKQGDLIVKVKNLVDANQIKTIQKWDHKVFEMLPEYRPLDDLAYLENFFKGFDIQKITIKSLLDKISQNILIEKISMNDFLNVLIQIFEFYLFERSLFGENEYAVDTFVERGVDKIDSLLPNQVKLIENLCKWIGLNQFSDIQIYPRMIIHAFQAYGLLRKNKFQFQVKMIKICIDENWYNEHLGQVILQWLNTSPKLTDELKEKIYTFIQRNDTELYHKIVMPPVSLNYFHEYNNLLENPYHGVSQADINKLQKQVSYFSKINFSSKYYDLEFNEIPESIRSCFIHWYSKFKGRKIQLPEGIQNDGIYVYELVSQDNVDHNPPRLAVVALVESPIDKIKDIINETSLYYERAAINSFKILRLLQVSNDYHHNTIYLISKKGKPLNWTIQNDSESIEVMNPAIIKKSAERIRGFTNGLNFEATKIIYPLIDSESRTESLNLLEIRHTDSTFFISRPPSPVDRSEIIDPKPIKDLVTEKHYEMGKMLNVERAGLLFDDGRYEELFFPDVDDNAGIGLNVYKGKVHGVRTLIYAGDFRFKGGALGEREGKKLASTIILAYLTNSILVAFHDGAGANIKESIASLGWAGAYFGAIAHTGGFANREKFKYWFKNHINRSYFEKVLNHFGIEGDIDNLINSVKSQLRHFHLHVGATVGMLVYGASISRISIMNNNQESYRVLTGATIVKNVLGEQETNYTLGGAKVHSEISGDIEMMFETEAQVIDKTREFIDFLENPKVFSEIQRSDDVNKNDEDITGVVIDRETLCRHLDFGKFLEIRPRLKKSKSILTGFASIAGQALAIEASRIHSGISHVHSLKKVTGLIESAQDLQVPLLLITGDQFTSASFPYSANWLQMKKELYVALQKLTVPKISFAFGPRAIEQTIHYHMDLTIYVQDGNETSFELKRIEQICPLNCQNFSQAFDQLSMILKYISINSSKNKDVFKSLQKDDVNRDVNLELPQEVTQPYDMRTNIHQIFDKGTFLELWKNDGLPLITGFATLGGISVGVIADDPKVEGGAQNYESIEKFTRMQRLCEQFAMPLVEINDSPAFKPGKQQEHMGIQGVGGRSIREECLSGIPKLAVTLRQNYGGRLIHANLITLGPPRKGLVIEGAKMGVMGAKGAVDLLYRKKIAVLSQSEASQQIAIWQREFEDKQLNCNKAVQLGYVERPIQIRDLRRKMYEQLNRLLQQNSSNL